MGFSGPEDGFSVDHGRPRGALCASAGMAFGNPVICGGGEDFHEVFLQYRLEESVGAMT